MWHILRGKTNTIGVRSILKEYEGIFPEIYPPKLAPKWMGLELVKAREQTNYMLDILDHSYMQPLDSPVGALVLFVPKKDNRL